MRTPLGRYTKIRRSDPRAIAVCDYSGLFCRHADLVKQMAYVGTGLVWNGFLVNKKFADKPNPQTLAKILMPDPLPVFLPRPDTAVDPTPPSDTPPPLPGPTSEPIPPQPNPPGPIPPDPNPPGPNPNSEPQQNTYYLAGYLDCTASGSAGSVNMSQAAQDGYQGAIIYTFGSVGKSTIPLSTQVYFDSNFWNIQNLIPGKVTEAKTLNLNGTVSFPVNLLSFGGEYNETNTPGTTFIATGIVSQEICHEVADNMVALAKSVGCNGIDLDFEMSARAWSHNWMPLTGPYQYVAQFLADGSFDFAQNLAHATQLIHDLCARIKTHSTREEPFYLSAAPQINNLGTREVPIYQFVSADQTTLFSAALQEGFFDFLWMQVYNTGPEQDPTFIMIAWDQLDQSLKKDSKTLMMVGYPANSEAAGQFTIYHPNASVEGHTNDDPWIENWKIPTLTTSQAITTGLDSYPALKPTLLTLLAGKAMTYKRFGGTFCWSLNRDYYSVYYEAANGKGSDQGSFAKNMSPIFTQPTQAVQAVQVLQALEAPPQAPDPGQAPASSDPRPPGVYPYSPGPPSGQPYPPAGVYIESDYY